MFPKCFLLFFFSFFFFLKKNIVSYVDALSLLYYAGASCCQPCKHQCFHLERICSSIPEKNITRLTRLDHSRALSQIAERLKVYVTDIKNVIIWGNHSSTQYPNANRATVTTTNGERPIKELDTDDHWYLKISNMFIFCHFHMFKLFWDIGW